MLMNVKMPTIVDILTFITGYNSCLAELGMKKVLKPWGLVWIHNVFQRGHTNLKKLCKQCECHGFSLEYRIQHNMGTFMNFR